MTIDAPVRPDLDAGPARRPGLSPSRAGDFQRCPLLFRYRSVDRLPEPASPAAARGTLVHAVLEDLFDLPAAERTPAAARAMVAGRWEQLLLEDPRCTALFDDPAALSAWLRSAEALLDTYFRLEDPTRLEPSERELAVLHDLEDGPQLRGIVDRVDVAPNGWVRVVDYKTGRSPSPGFEASALFQMRFYALVLWRTRGVVPKLLQLEYLGDGTVVRHEPTEAELLVLEQRVRAVWAAVQEAARTGRWEARPSRLCDWCSFRDRCPSFGGTVVPPDPDAVEHATGVRPLDAAPAA
ncbi:RecB family exonuclease [Cellulomonas marina]|uniref:Putative RecB family exonuclease n=1 Tax=Cellulomonas marina TaxID=988821 RepID=A0A1I0ZPI1_9CELL|nr:PD-(D/E)XK nuclease family protein [Cellulomonas marina]GIG28851.1 recombinase RecB [Cellulomonas marina]SFB27634.1 putative RecB family exonuclease [Cellulomonas marina]